jgi:hypothetical protein
MLEDKPPAAKPVSALMLENAIGPVFGVVIFIPFY